MVECPKCAKSIRSDHLVRHMRTHNKAQFKERVVVSTESIDQARVKCQKIIGDYITKGYLYRDDSRVLKSRNKRFQVGKFGNFEFVRGNLTCENALKVVIRDHYSYITPKWAFEIDNLVAHDEKWQDFFRKNKNYFMGERVWFHFITEDLHLYDKCLNKFEEDTVICVIPGACKCVCSEMKRQPFSEPEIREMIHANNVHMHFILSIDLDEMQYDKLFDCVNEISNGRVLTSSTRGAVFPLDKIRLFHYINRRESSVGLCTHLHFRDNDFERNFVYCQKFSELPTFTQISRRDFEMLKLTCKFCKKRNGNKLCNLHVNLNPEEEDFTPPL